MRSDSEPIQPAFTGAPSYFRARCLEARRGGQFSYADAGFHLGIHLRNHIADDAGEEEWNRIVDDLVERLEPRDDGTPVPRRESSIDGFDLMVVPKVIAWFEVHMPKCIRLVPPGRRGKFVEGLLQARERGDL